MKMLTKKGKWVKVVQPDMSGLDEDGRMVMGQPPAEDIDMLLNIVRQLMDECEDPDSIGTQIPDPTRHCKYWTEIGAKELCELLERKYRDAPRLVINDKYLTEY